MIHLDIATLLLIYTTSVFANALALLWLHWNTRPQRGIVTLAAGFVAIGVGSLLASLGEQAALPAVVWTNASLYLGVLGYATLVAGVRLLDRPLRWYHLGLAIVLTGATVFLVVTGTWADNHIRASLFHGSAGLLSLVMAIELVVGRSREPLPTKGLFAGVELVAAGVYLAEVILIWVSPWYLTFLAWGFVVEILLNFFTGLFVYALVKEKAEVALRVAAETDPLTGIGNRRWFFGQIPTLCGPDDVVIMVDADHFKTINDAHGHQAGDAALMFLVGRMRSVLREGEILARFGGEEFALFLPRTTATEAAAVAERIRASVEGGVMVHEGTSLRLTVSLGVHPARPGQTVDSALVAADHALYQAKAEGRNRVCLGGLGAAPQARG